VTCPPPGPCELPGTCNPKNGYCSYPQKSNEVACDDGNPCTPTSKCLDGVCAGEYKKCPALDSCQGDGVCDPSDGKCKNYPNLCTEVGATVQLGDSCNSPEREKACEDLGLYCVLEGPKDAESRPAVCCNEPCTDVCYSCAVPGSVGKCIPSPEGVDLRDECWPGDDCFMTCSGGDAPHCDKAKKGTQCAPPRCVDATHSRGAAICAEYGAACPESVIIDCGAYACNSVDGMCRGGCATADDCAPGFACDKGTCAKPPSVSYGQDASCALSPGSPAGPGRKSAMLALLGLAALAASIRGAGRRP